MKHLHDAFSSAWIEITCWFICKDKARTIDKGASYSKTLLLAS